MHSTDGEHVTFHHDGDFSGFIYVTVNGVPVSTTLKELIEAAYSQQHPKEVYLECTVTDPLRFDGETYDAIFSRKDVAAILARYVRTEAMRDLENMTDNQILSSYVADRYLRKAVQK